MYVTVDSLSMGGVSSGSSYVTNVEPNQVICLFIDLLSGFPSMIENRVLNSLNVELPVYPFILSVFTS